MPDFRYKLRPRYAVLGGVILFCLGLLAIKLWSMQVLDGAAYAQQADQNRVRSVTTVAPRGRILDRNGKALVSNRPTFAVLLEPRTIDDEEMLLRLSALLDVPVSDIKERLASKREAALAPRVVAIDVPFQSVAYLAEHESQFDGVAVETRAIRQYPQGTLAAHVLGYTGEMSEADLEDAKFKGYDPTDIIGKSGAEASFESVLQGDRGAKVLQVDAAGRPREVLSETEPKAGHDIELTIDSNVQRIAEKALKDAIDDAHKDKYRHAKAGAAVALDVKTGEVIAMASLPTYDPTVFLGGVSEKEWASLNSQKSEYPLQNRALGGQYPPASTFKAFTGLAGLQYGVARQWGIYTCAGKWTKMGEQWKKYCWKRTGHGNVSFMEGIEQSCDTVFYEIGYTFYKRGHEEIQKMSRSFGFGSRLGIDLPGEMRGRVPDAKWKRAFNEDYPEYRKWLPGDTVNMAIGQGDVLVTPLQLAAAYGGIANGGKVMRPHVLKDVLGSDGKPVLESESEVAFTGGASKQSLDIMDSALRAVTRTGTAKGAFSGFGASVAGKTGTAEVTKKDDYAWFVGYAPAENPKYVVAVVIEQGGHGGSVAGPAARQILAALLGKKVTHIQATDVSR